MIAAHIFKVFERCVNNTLANTKILNHWNVHLKKTTFQMKINTMNHNDKNLVIYQTQVFLERIYLHQDTCLYQ